MATYYKQNCPLCGTTTEYCWVDYNNCKYFDCPKCTTFQISKCAEEVLVEKSQQRRAVYANQALNAPDNHLLVIRMPNHEFLQQSTDDLQVSFVLKSELSLNCE